MSSFVYKQNLLYCEERSLSALGAEFGTPLYVYSRQRIVENCRRIHDAFDGHPHLATYAVKANGNIHIMKLIAEQGFGADAGSKGELFLALKAGFKPGAISFSGVGKRDDEIEYGLKNDILAFNVESEQEIDVISRVATGLGRKARILLRVNLDIDAGTHAYVSTAKKHNKFGVPWNQAADILRRALSLPGVEVRGIHSHIGSQVTKVGPFASAARALADLVGHLRAEGIPVQDLDFGGGFGVPYHGVIQHPQLPEEKPEVKGSPVSEFIRAVMPVLRSTGCSITIQPGRSVVGDAGVLLTNVVVRKETGERTFIIVDGGMNDLLRPSLYQAHHQIVPLELRGSEFERVDVVGPCCESGDFFALDRMLPRVQRGEGLALMCTGAYGLVLSSNYNARLRAAEVLVSGDNAMLIRKRQELEDLSD